MEKKLVRHGNSLALVIDRAVLRLLGIDAGTPLSVQTDGKNLIVTPAGSAPRKRRFRKALQKANKQFGPALRKLAD